MTCFKVFDFVRTNTGKKKCVQSVHNLDTLQCRYCHARQQSPIYCRIGAKHTLPEYTTPLLGVQIVAITEMWESSRLLESVDTCEWVPSSEASLEFPCF